MAGTLRYKGIVPDGYAYCTGCESLHPVQEFGLDSRKKNGLASWCKSYYATYMRHKRHGSPSGWRDYYLRTTFGISEEDFLKLLASQGGGCAICGAADAWSDEARLKNFSVDHDHNCCPGKKSCGECVRGLLCNTCNRGLGQFRDEPKMLRKAADYLEISNARIQAASGAAPG